MLTGDAGQRVYGNSTIFAIFRWARTTSSLLGRPARSAQHWADPCVSGRGERARGEGGCPGCLSWRGGYKCPEWNELGTGDSKDARPGRVRMGRRRVWTDGKDQAT